MGFFALLVKLVFAFIVFFATTGCEIDLGSSGGDDDEPVEQAAAPAAEPATAESAAQSAAPPPATGSGDEINVGGAVMYGPHASVHPQNARVTRSLSSANVEGGNVRLAYQSLGWPSNDSGIGNNIDGRVYIFWSEGGRIVGGHFDWKSVGQTVKTLNNIGEGYLSGRRPPRGATVGFCIVRNNGSERTNTKLSNTPY